MRSIGSNRTIVVADDDADDCALVRDAFREAKVDAKLEFVADGNQLLDYLRQHSEGHSGSADADPTLILLDLNMPHKDGRESLLEIRSDFHLQHLPIVVLSTSAHPRDVLASYRAGANSYIVKPTRFADFTRLANTLADYWLDTVKLPPASRSTA